MARLTRYRTRKRDQSLTSARFREELGRLMANLTPTAVKAVAPHVDEITTRMLLVIRTVVGGCAELAFRERRRCHLQGDEAGAKAADRIEGAIRKRYSVGDD